MPMIEIQLQHNGFYRTKNFAKHLLKSEILSTFAPESCKKIPICRKTTRKKIPICNKTTRKKIPIICSKERYTVR